MKQFQFWCWIVSYLYNQSRILVVTKGAKRIIQYKKAEQKEVQHAPKNTDYISSLVNSETTKGTNYSIRSNLHNIPVEKQNKLASNPFDDKRIYLNQIQSLPWDKHTQQGHRPCLYCLKLILLYQKEIIGNKADEKIYLNTWYLKETLTHQQLLKLISDRAHLL